MPVMTAEKAGGNNVLAALDMLAWSEMGPQMLADPAAEDGYKLLLGLLPGRLKTFVSYTDHPRVVVELPNLGIRSTAAGRY